jgi:hypothetical protein
VARQKLDFATGQGNGTSQTNISATLGLGAPNQGDTLFALVFDFSGTGAATGAGWTRIFTQALSGFDVSGYVKRCGSGESATQTPYTRTASALAWSTGIWRYIGAEVYLGDGFGANEHVAAAPPLNVQTVTANHAGGTGGTALMGAVANETSGSAGTIDSGFTLDDTTHATAPTQVYGHLDGVTPGSHTFTATLTGGASATCDGGLIYIQDALIGAVQPPTHPGASPGFAPASWRFVATQPGSKSGPVANTMNLSANLTFTGNLTKALSIGTTQGAAGLSFTGKLVKAITRATFAASLSFTGAIVKRTGKSLAGGLSFTGNALPKSVGKALSAGLSFTGAQTRAIAHLLSGGLSFTGGFTKQTNKPLSGGLSFTGLLTQIRIHLVSLSASLSFTGALGKQTSKSLGGGLSFTGAFTKATSRTLSAALSFAGAQARQTAKSLSGNLTFSGGMSRQIRKSLAAGLSFTGAQTKFIGKLFVAVLSFVGSLVPVKQSAIQTGPPFIVASQMASAFTVPSELYQDVITSTMASSLTVADEMSSAFVCASTMSANVLIQSEIVP